MQLGRRLPVDSFKKKTKNKPRGFSTGADASCPADTTAANRFVFFHLDTFDEPQQLCKSLLTQMDVLRKKNRKKNQQNVQPIKKKKEKMVILK